MTLPALPEVPLAIDATPGANGPDVTVGAPEARPVEFRAGRAAAILALMFLAQFAFGLAFLVIAVLVTFLGIYFGVINSGNALARVSSAGLPILLVGSVLAGCAAVYAATRAWLWNEAVDPTGESFGWKRVNSRRIFIAAFVGVAMGSLCWYITGHFFPLAPGAKLGPLALVASRGGASRAAWAIAGLLIAPAAEEFLFRGVLLRGFAASWGLTASAVVVSALFVLLHLPEFVHYWPACGAIIALALGTLAARLLSGSLAPAVAVHAAYNLVMIVSVYTQMPG